MSDKISILVANYNNGRFISEAIESVLAQDYENWEMVIVDDCSTDDSLSVIEEYLSDVRIKLFVNDKNGGCGFTKKRCLDLATGKFAAFLDPDDALFPEAIGVMVAEFDKYPGASLINSRDVFCDENLVPYQVDPNSQDVHDKGSYLIHELGGVTHFAVFRMEKYRLTVGLSTEFTKAVDQDLYYLLDEVGTIYFVDQVLYYYRIHKGGISTNNNVVGANYQNFKVKRKIALRRLTDPKFKDQRLGLRRLVARCEFHLSILEGRYAHAPFKMLNYAFKGGSTEVAAMFMRLVKYPKRVLNSLFRVYKIK